MFDNVMQSLTNNTIDTVFIIVRIVPDLLLRKNRMTSAKSMKEFRFIMTRAADHTVKIMKSSSTVLKPFSSIILVSTFRLTFSSALRELISLMV